MEFLLFLLYPAGLGALVVGLFTVLRSQEGKRALKIAKTNLTPVEDIASGYAAVAASVKKLRAAKEAEDQLHIDRWEKEFYGPEGYAKVLEERKHQKMLDEGTIKSKMLTPQQAKFVSAEEDWVPLPRARNKQAEDDELSYTQRRIQRAGAFVRQAPSTSAATYGVATGGSVLRFDGFVRGESVAGNNIWFVYIGKESGLPKYVHSIATTDRRTNGLPDMTPSQAGVTLSNEGITVRNAAGDVCLQTSAYVQMPVAEVARRVAEDAKLSRKYKSEPKTKIPSTVTKVWY